METVRSILNDPTGEKRAWAVGLGAHALIYSVVCFFAIGAMLCGLVGFLVICRWLLGILA